MGGEAGHLELAGEKCKWEWDRLASEGKCRAMEVG